MEAAVSTEQMMYNYKLEDMNIPKVVNEVIHHKTREEDNLTKEERRALVSLKKKTEIIIQS